MNYLIHNKGSVLNESELRKAKLFIEAQIFQFEQVLDKQANAVVLDLYFSKDKQGHFLVSYILNLYGEIVFTRETGSDLRTCLQSVFKQMKLAIVKNNYRRNRVNSIELKEQQVSVLEKYAGDLQEMKSSKTRDVFNHLLKLILKELAKYIRRRIKAAEMTTAIRRGRFKIQELLDELYLRVYERFEEIPKDAKDINNWLYQLADELLRELFNEISFENQHFQDIEKIVESEYRSMEEKFTVNADQEIIPVEELDEFDGNRDLYAADDLFLGEDEDSLLDEITLELNQKEIHFLIEKELAKLPIFKRTIMDLYLISQMSVEEIAEMKEVRPGEVENVIHEINKDLKRKLSLMI